MVISNYELAVLIGKLTGSNITSMSYGAALAVFRDDSAPCDIDDVAEILRSAMRPSPRKKGKKLAEFTQRLCAALRENYCYNDPIPPLPEMNSEKWDKEWGVKE